MKKNILLTGFLAGALVFGWSVQTQAMKRKREEGNQETKEEVVDYLDQIVEPEEQENEQVRVLNKRRKTEEPTTQQNSGTNSGTQFNNHNVLGNGFLQDFSSIVSEDNNTGFLNFLKSAPGRLRDGFKAFFMNRQVNQQVNNQQVNQQQVIQQPTVPYDVQAFQDACNGVKNLAGRNLRGAPLAGRHLEGVNLTGAHLEDAHLEEAHLEDAVIINANMAGAHCERSFFNRAKIINTNLSGAFFNRAEINDAFLLSSDGIGQSMTFLLTTPPTLLQRETLEELYKLFGQVITQAEIQTLIDLKVTFGNIIDPLRQTDASGAIFTGAQLNNTLLIGVNLIHATLSDMELNKTRFIRCSLQSLQVHDVLAKGVVFSLCNGSKRDGTNDVLLFENVTFSENSKIRRTNFTGVTMNTVTFLNSFIQKSNFSYATLNGIRFVNSEVEDTDMSYINANFEGNYFSFDNTKLEKINFSQSHINGLLIQNRKIMGVDLDFTNAHVRNSFLLGEVIRRDSKEERIGGFSRRSTSNFSVGTACFGAGVGGGLAFGATLLASVLFPGLGLLAIPLIAGGTGVIGVSAGGMIGGPLGEKLEESNQDFSPVNINSGIHGLNLTASTFSRVKFSNICFFSSFGLKDILDMRTSIFDNVTASDNQYLETIKSKGAFVNGKYGDGQAALYLKEEDKTLNKMKAILLASLPGAINTGIKVAGDCVS